MKWKKRHADYAEQHGVDAEEAASAFKQAYPLAFLQISSQREREALDLKIFHRGLFACIKTTQNIDRMPVVYSPHDPLMVLTPAGRYLVGCQQRFLHGYEILLLMGVPVHRIRTHFLKNSELQKLGGNSISVRAATVAICVCLAVINPALAQRYLRRHMYR